ncbi:type III toxin-antitoxin system ToxN/AbiQ family toxin [Alkalihalobacillus sp. FSL R5-0424]
MNILQIYEIDKMYTDYLRKVDDRVRDEKDHPNAKTRKYIGLLLEINSFKYFAPLASPKRKFMKMKNDKDFMKINGNQHGAINFNNMIPVHDSALIEYDINAELDYKYKSILIAQTRFIRKNKEEIISIATELYRIMTSDLEEDQSEKRRLNRRCCRYLLLEEACSTYIH